MASSWDWSCSIVDCNSILCFCVSSGDSLEISRHDPGSVVRPGILGVCIAYRLVAATLLQLMFRLLHLICQGENVAMKSLSKNKTVLRAGVVFGIEGDVQPQLVFLVLIMLALHLHDLHILISTLFLQLVHLAAKLLDFLL